MGDSAQKSAPRQRVRSAPATRRHAAGGRKTPRRHARPPGLGRRLVGRVVIVTVGFAVLASLALLPQVGTWVGDLVVDSSTVNVTDSCAAVNVTHPHGVGRPAARDAVAKGERRVTTFVADRKLYRAHVALDTDGDGIACEVR